MAAMPSVGRIKQLLVMGGAAAALLAVGASTASAAPNEVWLWACHGPNGEALSTPYTATQSYGGTVTANGGGCTANGGSLTLSVPSDGTTVGGWSQALAQFDGLPPNTTLTTAKLTQSFTGFGQAGASSALSYVSSGTASGPLQTVGASQPAPADGEQTVNGASVAGHGDSLRLRMYCDTTPPSGCAAGTSPSVTFSKAGLQVVETNEQDAVASETEGAPKVAVGGKSNPAAGDIKLDVKATDPGVGLDFAEAYLANAGNTALVSAPVRQKFADTNAAWASCKDLTPATPTVIDLPLGAVCPTVANAGLTIPTKDAAGNLLYPNGNYTLIVRVVDLSGRETIFRDGSALPAVQLLNNVDLGSPSQTLNIGTSGLATTPGATNTGANNNGVAGASSTSCNSPRLSVVLAQKPVRVSRGVPVLRYNHRYRFSGRLTCVINGKRQSAPKRARIDLQNKVGRKTTDKSGTTVASRGAFATILSYPSSRTLIFRFTNSDGKKAEVKIKIKVEKKKKAKR